MESAAFIEAVKSDFGLPITEVEKVTSGWANQVHKANLNGKVVFIRINKNSEIFPLEILGYEIFKKQGIPVPEVIAYQEKPSHLGYPTMILSAASGIEITKANLSLEQKNSVYEKVGTLVRKINEVTLDGFGSLKVVEGKLRGKFQSWKESWMSSEKHFYVDAEIIRNNKLLTDTELQKLEEVYREIGSLDFGRASLLHRDVHSTHIFVTGDSVTGIIDLGRLEAGDPRYDIAMSLVFQKPEEQEAFRKGYGALSDDPMVNKYILAIAGTKIAFRSKNGLKEGAEEAVRVFREALALLVKK